MKRKLLLLLALMAIGLSGAWAYDFSAVAPSGQTLYYNITGGNAVVTYQNSSSPRYSNLTGALVIPASVTYYGTTYSVTSIGRYAFYGCSGLTSVTIPNSVTYIGYSAFYNCSGLTSVTIPNSVTTIGEQAFYNCSGLTSVTIPNSVTSIEWYAFGGCSGLTSVTIGNSVTSIEWDAFYGCSNVDTLYYNARNLTTTSEWGNSSSSYNSYGFRPMKLKHLVIGDSVQTLPNNVFYNQDSLTSVTIPNSVTTIGNYAFQNCSGLTGVTIPNSVTTIGYSAFYNCSGLTSVTIPNSVTSIGERTFYNCSGLTSVTIPNSVTSIGNNAFGQVRLVSYCGSATGSPWGATRVGCFYEDGEFIFEDATQTTILAYIGTGSSVTIPNSVTTIGERAFSGCSGLTSVTIPNSVTSIGSYAFEYCSGLTSVTIGNSVTTIGERAFSGCSGLTSVTIPNSVTSIGSYAFEYCSGLTSVTIGNSVTSIEWYAFYGCSNVDTLYYNARNLTTTSEWGNSSSSYNSYGFRPMKLKHLVIGDSVQTLPNNVFYNQDSLTSVIIPNSVTTIGDGAFENCSGLTSVTIPYSVTSIGQIAFYGCSGLTSVTIPNSVTSIGSYAFEYCSGLTSVTIPNSVTSIGSSAFKYCSGLTSVTIGNSVTSIEWYAFYGCSNVDTLYYNARNLATTSDWGNSSSYNTYGFRPMKLKYLAIGDSVQTLPKYVFYNQDSLTSVIIPNSVTSIGSGAFYGCSGLTSVTIPNSVTSIGERAFYNCSGLTSVTIGNSVTTIGWYAFENCRGLTSVTIPNSVTFIGERTFYNCSGLTSVTIGNSVTHIGWYAFENCRGLTSVTIPNSVTSIGNNAFGQVRLVSYCGSAMGSPWGATRVGCFYEDGEFIFEDATQTTILAYIGTGSSVTIPNSVTTIGNYAFYGCSNVDTLYYNARNLSTTSNWYNSSSSNNSYGFRSMGLNHLVIGDSVQTLPAGVFYGQSNLTSVTIPNSVTSIGNSAFYGCSNVDTLYYNARNLTTISDWYNSSSDYNSYGFRSMGLTHLVIGDSVQTLPDGVFYGQSGLNSVTIPNSVTSIGDYAFYYCSGLTNVTIPNWVTSIGSSAFSGCSNLTSVTIGGSVSTVGNSAFNDCSSLTSIIIPDEVSMIGNGAFQNCSSAIYLEVGSNVFTIGDSAFAGCSRMMNTRMKCYPPTISYSTFSNYPTNRPVFIPCGTTTAYRNAPYWSVFYNLTEENCGHTVTVASANNHMGITTGGGIYPDGDTATLYAIPLTGYQFDHWNDNNTSNPRNVVVTQDLSYTAFFRTLDTITLIDTVISYVPVHDTTIIDNYIHDTAYVDVFVPVHDTTIIDNYIHDTTYVDVYIHDTTFVDVFVHDTVTEQLTWYSLSVVSGNSARGLVAGNGHFPEGTEVEIAAIPIEGSRFVQWQDGNTENPRRVSLLSDMNFIATFDVANVGVTDVEMAKHTISSQRGQIIVENAAGDRIRIFDEVGRCISTTNSMENTRIFNMPASGVYMVQVGNHPAEKVVVIR